MLVSHVQFYTFVNGFSSPPPNEDLFWWWWGVLSAQNLVPPTKTRGTPTGKVLAIRHCQGCANFDRL